jgi:hypothetical protein
MRDAAFWWRLNGALQLAGRYAAEYHVIQRVELVHMVTNSDSGSYELIGSGAQVALGCN